MEFELFKVRKRSIIVTPEYLQSLISHVGGISSRGLRLIGESPGWQAGWKKRALGRTVDIDEAELEAELALLKKRRSEANLAHRFGA